MINWTTITNRTEYENQRYNFLLQTEENGIPKLIPYNDHALPGAGGYITIGVGFNLEGSVAVRDEVFRVFGLIRNNPALSTTPVAPGQSSPQQIENAYIDQLIAAIGAMVDDPSALNTIMTTRAGDSRLATLGTRRSTFTFNDVPEIRATFDRLMTSIYEPKVNNWLAGIPDSRERTALISLAWNQKDTSPLLGNKLRTAITNGDRAEAWYEIRYNSNGGTTAGLPGLAKRRYFEADTFGLYNNAAANNDDDAKGAFRTYTRHKTTIDSYDIQFGAQVALANSDYNTTIVQTRQAWFQPARTHLFNEYITGAGISVTLNGDIFVGETSAPGHPAGTDADTLIGTSSNDLLFGETGVDTLKGGVGNDVLYGGEGNDFLHGQADNDFLLGGEGVDTYLYDSTGGTDILRDTDGLGRILPIGTKVPMQIMPRLLALPRHGGYPQARRRMHEDACRRLRMLRAS